MIRKEYKESCGGLMGNLRQRLQVIMKGRNGLDELNQGLFILTILLTTLSLFYFPQLMNLLATCVLCILIYRYFSRDLYSRREENRVFHRKILSVNKKMKEEKKIHKDKDHLYFNCPNCRQRLRVPKGKGKINVTCSYCSEVFIKKS